MPGETIDTPLGHVSKKTAIIGGGAAAVGLALLYRYEKQKQAAASAGANTEIDPATGYAYGSAEDAAALAAQGNYILPGGGGGGGTVGSIPSGGTGLPQGFGSNAEWVQFVIQYVTDKDVVSDSGAAMSAALGIYITGQVPTSDQTSLIQQAIAIAGYPPISGPNGYPPHINTNPPGNTTPPPPVPQPAPAPSPDGPTVLPQAPPPPAQRTYTVKSGDTLIGIAGRLGIDWHTLFSNNWALIENTAKQHGFPDSGGGHWIFPGEVLHY